MRGVEPGIQEVACKSFGGEEETAGYQRRGIKKEAERGGGQAVVAFAVKKKSFCSKAFKK